MHRSFLPFFCDPYTHEPLKLEVASEEKEDVREGFLVSSTNRYPIRNGVPRFVPPSNYADSFAWQWKKWPRVQFESENRGRPMEGHTRRMWEQFTGWDDHQANMPAGVILDLGCGPGRFVDIARSKGFVVIGLDYSGVVDVAVENFRDDPHVCICQADGLAMPIKSGVLDGAFTQGVLHHTPDPSKGVREIFRALKYNGAWGSVSVYSQNSYYSNLKVQVWRRIFNKLWPIAGHRPPLAYSYFAAYVISPLLKWCPPVGRILRFIFPLVDLPDRRWTLLDTFDSVTPSYQSAHTPFEVFKWMKDAGYSEIEPTRWGGTCFRGIKKLNE